MPRKVELYPDVSMVNEHITNLGYRLEFTEDVNVVTPLLKACELSPIGEVDGDWEATQYLMACTRAGGTAACIGWSRRPKSVVLHSLAVAPSSRGSGIGVGLLASAMGYIMDKRSVETFHLTTESSGARRLFASTGFVTVDDGEVPGAVRDHPTFREASEDAVPMSRRYDANRGLDSLAFRLILNETKEATLPLGSVFFFQQTGDVLEAHYRGGPVIRGHLVGLVDGREISFCWHQFVEEGELMSGDGHIKVEVLPDGRRELREHLDSERGSDNLLLREV